jgi:polyisoprenoid-binding protein YceI
VRYVLGAVVVAVVFFSGIVVGSWLYHHQQVSLATTAPSIPKGLLEQQTVVPCDEAACARLLTFQVVGALSEVSFYADLKLSRVSLPARVKGTANGVSGKFQLRQEGIWLTVQGNASFAVNLRNVKSEVPSRFINLPRLLETDEFPTAAFTVADVTGISPTVPLGKEQTLKLSGTLTLHGVQREVTWDVKARWEQSVVTALATTSVRYRDFDITVPNVGRTVSSNENVTLQAEIVAALMGSPLHLPAPK